jgi:hypothetical protein
MGIIILIALQNFVIFMMIELTFSWPWKRIILLIYVIITSWIVITY